MANCIHSFSFYSLLIVLGLTASTGRAQTPKKVIDHEQAWLGYFNQTRLSTRWGLWLDLHARRTDFLDRWNTLIVRPSLIYYVTDQVRLMAGYAHVTHYPANPEAAVRPEHRPWQQIWWIGRSGRLNLTQWIRSEQRYNRRTVGNELAEGYTFNWRLRYNVLLQVPLWGETIRPHVPNVVVQNELFVNAGRQITYNYFDQNRFFAGVSYAFPGGVLAQLGYMNQFVQQPVGHTFANNHTLRLFVFHTLDLRPKRN